MYDIDRHKDVIRLKLSREYKGDQVGFLYNEAKEWLKYDWVLTDDHLEAIKTHQRGE